MRRFPGAQVVFWPLTQKSTHAAKELWQITPDGRILFDPVGAMPVTWNSDALLDANRRG
ncbi:hypothetical protein ACGFMM_24665 [Streptomyces sp. NPDC048604]|uniref:hypothetical protein n=1 Tax=Streptomyces sp. NPDC048604 TaxID=3365578 RepID=UPI00371E8C39